ncbi:MAG: hypothetical protein FJX35_20110 [Alphaproteobacteria bacterium]|nr:hypothetical protein [Alphaproteobacteria bacterium]MBM3600512.1 hypothetical protein [Alphaproteobacteria bacterium]
MMDVRGGGGLGVWHGIVGEQQREAEDWYNREHHAERVAIDGFLRARRYVNQGTGPRYFSRYDVTDVTVLASQAYLKALDNPSPWSQKMFPHYRKSVRGAFTVSSRAGEAEGGYLVSLRFGDGAGAIDAALVRTLSDAVPKLVRSIGVLGVEIWQVDAGVSIYRSKEKELRGTGEPFPAVALLLDTSRPELAADALAEALPAHALATAAADTYQLVFQKFASHRLHPAGCDKESRP